MKKTHVSDLIEQNINELVEKWMNAVRLDEDILSDDGLPETGLRDHVPEMLEEICGILRTGEMPGSENTREAHVSAFTRYLQDYRGRDLAKELSLLRMILLKFLDKNLLSMPPEITLDEYLRATQTIHLYLDEEIRFAFSIYTEPHLPPHKHL